MKTCIILIPIYKSELDLDERLSVSISISNLKGFKVAWVAPESLDISFYHLNFGINECIRYDDYFFKSTENYSRLLLSSHFFEKFINYDFCLILQTDAIVLKPGLEHWLVQDYDYVGAPWKNGYELVISCKLYENINPIIVKSFVGNGGLSLRKINSNVRLFDEFPDVVKFWRDTGSAEDLFYSIVGNLSNNFKMPNIVTAAHFSHETDHEYMMQLTQNTIPFGVHAWAKYGRKYWLEIINNIKLMDQ